MRKKSRRGRACPARNVREDSPFIFGTVERGLALPRGVEDAALYNKKALAYSTQAGAFL